MASHLHGSEFVVGRTYIVAERCDWPPTPRRVEGSYLRYSPLVDEHEFRHANGSIVTVRPQRIETVIEEIPIG